MIDEISVCPVCRNATSVADLVRVKSESKTSKTSATAAVPKHKTSTKLDALLEEITNMRDHSKGTKCIVFSQWTSMLDLIQTSLDASRLRYLRLDGSLSQEQRERTLTQFRTDDQAIVCLATLRVGGVGLNLTMASRVYLMDPWWNPQVENQAIDRGTFPPVVGIFGPPHHTPVQTSRCPLRRANASPATQFPLVFAQR